MDPFNSDFMDVTVLKGKKFEEKIEMSSLLPDRHD